MAYLMLTEECEQERHGDCIGGTSLDPELVKQGFCGGGVCTCPCHYQGQDDPGYIDRVRRGVGHPKPEPEPFGDNALSRWRPCRWTEDEIRTMW